MCEESNGISLAKFRDFISNSVFALLSFRSHWIHILLVLDSGIFRITGSQLYGLHWEEHEGKRRGLKFQFCSAKRIYQQWKSLSDAQIRIFWELCSRRNHVKIRRVTTRVWPNSHFNGNAFLCSHRISHVRQFCFSLLFWSPLDHHPLLFLRRT